MSIITLFPAYKAYRNQLETFAMCYNGFVTFIFGKADVCIITIYTSHIKIGMSVAHLDSMITPSDQKCAGSRQRKRLCSACLEPLRGMLRYGFGVLTFLADSSDLKKFSVAGLG